MKTTLTLLALIASIAIADAQTIAKWTFETNTPADATDTATLSGIAADEGSGTASAVHASASTDYTTPSGNGSVNALSSNNWAVGDYYQFTLSTVGVAGIGVSWDQTGSNTGPRDFSLTVSADGAPYTQLFTYQVINATWMAGVPVTTTSYFVDLTGNSGVNNVASLSFRLMSTSTAPINSVNPVAPAGTSRVDNFTVAVVPEPSTLLAIASGSALLLMVRRRRVAGQ